MIRERIGPYSQAAALYPPAAALPTLAVAAATFLPAPVVQVQVLAYADDTAYAPATYKNVAAQPSRPVGYETAGWFQSLDGRYFEVQPDQSGRMQVAWFGDDIAGVRLAQAVSKRLRGTPGYFYELPTTGGTVITGTDEDFDLDFSDSTIALTQNCVAFVSIARTYEFGEMAVTAMAGNVLTVPSNDLGGGVSALAKGDIVKMADPITPIWWNQGQTRKGTYSGSVVTGEFGVVGSATGSTVTLRSTPEWASDNTPEYLREMLRTDVTGVADNGSGGIRVTFGHPHFGTTGLNYTMENVGGVTAANGTFPVTVISANVFDLVGPTFSGTYTSGGTGRKSLTYSIAAGFKIGKLRNNDCRIHVGKFFCAPSVTSHAARVVKAINCTNLDWKAYVGKSAGVIFSPVSCFGGTVGYYAASSGVGNTGYILTNAGSTIVIKVNGSGTTRHTFDGGAASTADGATGISASGAASYVSVYIEGDNVGSTEAAHATHDGTYRWSIYAPKSRQTTANVAMRGVGHTIYDARSSGAGAASDADDPDDTGPTDAGALSSFSQFYIGVVSAADNGAGAIRLRVDGRGGRGPNLAVGMKVLIGSAIGASAASTNGYWYLSRVEQTGSPNQTYVDLEGSTFVSSVGAEEAVMDAGLDAADDFTIINGMCEDNPGRIASAATNGGKMTIQGGVYRMVGDSPAVVMAGRELEFGGGALIEYSGVPSVTSSNNRIFGVGAFTTSITIDGARIKAAGALPHLINCGNRVQDVIVQAHNLEIYNTNGLMKSLYCNFSVTPTGALPPEGCKFGNIRVHGPLTAPAFGFTWEDFIAAGLVDGPIWVEGEKVADAPDA